MVDISSSSRQQQRGGGGGSSIIGGYKTLPNSNKHHHLLKRRRRECCLLLFTLLLIIPLFTFCSIFYLSSSSKNYQQFPASFTDTNNNRGGIITTNGNNANNNKTTHGIIQEKEEFLFPIWTSNKANEGLNDFNTYGNVALQGTYVYVVEDDNENNNGGGPDKCRQSQQQSPPSHCIIHFPFVDLKDVIKHDEALGPVYQIPSGRVRNKRKQTTPTKTEASFIKQQSAKKTKKSNNNQNYYYALLTRTGNKGFATGVKVNQDRAFILSLNDDNTNRQNQQKQKQQEFIMGIFDGHGDKGQIVSNYATLEFPRLFYKKLLKKQQQKQQQEQQDIVKKAITETFLQIDDSLPKRDEILSGGCTASIAIRLEQDPHLLYVANLGDSTTFVVTYTRTSKKDVDINVNIVYQTKSHKPHLPEERARIEKAGGTITPPVQGGGSSRIICPIGIKEDNNAFALAMSRSIGDKSCKKIGLVAEPTIDIINLNEIISKNQNNIDGSGGMFVVSASDGILDKVSLMFVANHLSKSFLYQDQQEQQHSSSSSQTPAPTSLLEACEQLIMKSSYSWISDYGGMRSQYRDDITIAVSKII